MNSKTKWSIQLGTVSLALALSAVPLSAQIHIPGMQFGFMKADAARDLYNSGRTYYDNNKFAQAESVFREVLKKYPRNQVADDSCYYLARALARQGKVDEAKAEIEIFKKQYSKSEWLKDVQELQMELTREAPPSYVLALTPAVGPTPGPGPTPPFPGQTPAAAPPAVGVRVPGQTPAPPAVGGRGQGRVAVSPEVSLQQEVLRVLFQENADRAIEIAGDRLKADPTDQVVLGNLYMVAQSRSMKALPLLVTLVKTSPDSRTRRDAVLWISRSRGEKDAIADILISLVPSMTTDEDSSGITSALSQLNTPRTIDALAGIARDKSKTDRVRNDALNWIANSQVTNRLTLLEDIYKSNMDNPTIRRRVIQNIGQSKDPQAVTILGNIATSDPDINVKREAVNYLGQIKTPEAMKALEALLTKKP